MNCIVYRESIWRVDYPKLNNESWWYAERSELIATNSYNADLEKYWESARYSSNTENKNGIQLYSKENKKATIIPWIEIQEQTTSEIR